MIEIDLRQAAKLELKLKRLGSRGIPFAARHALNQTAFDAMKKAKSNVSQNMILRNKHTVNSIRVQRARSLDMRTMHSITGSTEEYMARQEEGGIVTKEGKHGHPIATSYSAAQEGAQPRTRLPTRANKMRNIQLQRKRVRASNRRQKNLIAVRAAAKSGNRYVYLKSQRAEGIFRVIGRRKHLKVKMVYDLSRAAVRTPRNPWLAPASAAAVLMTPKYYAEALKFQLNR